MTDCTIRSVAVPPKCASKRQPAGNPLGGLLDKHSESLLVPPTRLATGLIELDRLLGGGFVLPSMVLLAAEPKFGKSMMAQKIAAYHAESGGYSIVYDFENGERRYLTRLVARRAQVDVREVEKDTEVRGAMQRAINDWQASPAADNLVLMPRPSGLEDFAEGLRVQASQADDKQLLVVVDSAQKLPFVHENRRTSIDRWLRLLEELRDELDACLLMVSELRRGEKGTYDGPGVPKESGDLEYSADLTLMLSPDRRYLNGRLLKIAYNRDGESGDVAFYSPVFPYFDIEEHPLRSGKAVESTQTLDMGGSKLAYAGLM